MRRAMVSPLLTLLLISFYFTIPGILSFQLPSPSSSLLYSFKQLQPHSHLSTITTATQRQRHSHRQQRQIRRPAPTQPLPLSPLFLSLKAADREKERDDSVSLQGEKKKKKAEEEIGKGKGVSDFLSSQLPILRYLWPKDDPSIQRNLLFSLLLLLASNALSLKVPFILQKAIDDLTANSANPSLLLSKITRSFLFYGLLRAAAVVFAEAKACRFALVSQSVLKKFAYTIFCHLHALDSAFHLTTPSGVLSVAYVRAVRGFQTMLLELVFSIAPTVVDLLMVSAILLTKFGWMFSTVTMTTFVLYLLYTIRMTQERVKLRQELVDVDNQRNGFLIDSILNHEIVKLFNNEKREISRFDSYLSKIEKLSIDCTYLIARLNIGQAFLFSFGLVASLYLALQQVVAGRMSVGDIVAINAMLLQLAIPFNNMGYTYQELRQSLVDMAYIRQVLEGKQPAIKDLPGAVDLDDLSPRLGPSSVEFRNVSFSYKDEAGAIQPGMESEVPALLRGISFTIEPGMNVALVGPSGSGKSTTLKLITRMLEPDSGQVLIDGVDSRQVTLESLRRRLAVVPQDTSLFDETINYNIRYGKPEEASEAEVEEAIDKANLKSTIEKLPLGLKTVVGERGARLSGGERQKVSIARAMLRNPSLILCDEVTSSVDAFAEQDIIATLRAATAQRTTLTVAHRLSSVAHSDLIIVLEKGQIVETGTHQQLLQKPDGIYRRMWVAQNGLAIEEGKHEGEEGRRGMGGGEGEVEREDQEEVKDGEGQEELLSRYRRAEEQRWRTPRVVREFHDMGEEFEFNEREEKAHLQSNRDHLT